MRTKHLARLALLPAFLLALVPTWAHSADEFEVETRDLPVEAQQELARATPDRGEAVEVDVPEASRDRGDVQFDDFYAGLSADGNWVQTPDYGWVWVPYRQAQVSDWRPYLYGQWVWTRYGWTWVSEENFGWATYHYGRWSFAPAYGGWFWVPGFTWGPAWVVWRYGDTAIGWAPLSPGYVTWGPSYPFYWDQWVFVGPSFFYARPVHRHWYHSRDVVVRHYHSTRWAHNWRREGGGSNRVYSGPRRSTVERVSSRPVRTAQIETTSRPARASYTAGSNGGRVSLYRPDASNAMRPSGPRAPASMTTRSATPGGGSRRLVGSGLDRPQSQAVAPQRGAVRAGTPPRSGGSTVRSTPPGAASSPGVRAPEGSGVRRTPAPPAQPQRRAAPPPAVRTPSGDGSSAPRRPSASLAPTPNGSAPSRSAPAVRPSAPTNSSQDASRSFTSSGGYGNSYSPSRPSYAPASPGVSSRSRSAAPPSRPSAPRATARPRR